MVRYSVGVTQHVVMPSIFGVKRSNFQYSTVWKERKSQRNGEVAKVGEKRARGVYRGGQLRSRRYAEGSTFSAACFEER